MLRYRHSTLSPLKRNMTQLVDIALVLVVGLALGTLGGYGFAFARYNTQIANLQNEAGNLSAEIVSRNSMLNTSHQREANVSRSLSLAPRQVNQLNLQAQISQGKQVGSGKGTWIWWAGKD